ncbi:MAG: SanA protein [Bergeyella sp.]|nr:SanA protein [Bergeyella sp.]
MISAFSRGGAFFLEFLFLFLLYLNMWVFSVTEQKTYARVSQVPFRNTALVLGTSPRMKSGDANPYFVSRMNAVSQLYFHKKVRKILVSGEKSKGYDEPGAMKKYLVFRKGIPEEVVTEDPYGFSTKISVFNCKEIYKEKDVIIVSQKFHNLRALLYAGRCKLHAVAFDAQDVLKNENFYRNQFREFLARVYASFLFFFWDCGYCD